jgi:tetratricopeptide (TPR) repeat protein
VETSTPDTDRAFGLLLFEAEESLARGAPDRSLVLASKAVKERPESLTARSLMERARRELLQGRRREKLESRVREARSLLERGQWAQAEKIVTSALKLIPDHEVALELFGRIRDMRLRPGTVEAEAEGELQKLAMDQAHKAAAAARAALDAGWNRQAFIHLRRGLRQVPDHPELLSLLKETQGSMEKLALERTRRRALLAQVRAGLDLFAQGKLDASLRMFRAVLLEEPDNARAQAAVQEVRQAWLRRTPGATPAEEPVARTPAPPAPAAAVPAEPRALPPPRALPLEASSRSRIPVEILLPRTRQRATPIAWILAGAAILIGVTFVYVIAERSGHPPIAPPSPAPPPPSSSAPPPAAAPGPLDVIDTDLRRIVERTLSDYGRALERADADLLARARPDLTPAERQQRLAPFLSALNAATDIRVLDVAVRGNEAVVTILFTPVIVDGRQLRAPPTEEELRFARRGGVWFLRERRAAGKP